MPNDKLLAKADRLTAEFLAAFPELSDEFGYHKTLGPIMSRAGVRAFAAWAVKSKGVPQANADRMVAIMDGLQHRFQKKQQ